MVAIADREQAIAYREQVRALAVQIGLCPAARALGLNPERVKKWGQRYKWNISAIMPAKPGRSCERPLNVPEPINVLASLMAQDGDRTRLAMARTARRAFEHSDTLTDEQLHELQRGVALEKHAKVAAIAHNWSQTQANVAVQVNVPLPDETEREQMANLDAKLDAIAAKLKS